MLIDVLRAHGTESAAVAEQGCGALKILALREVNDTALVAAGARQGE